MNALGGCALSLIAFGVLLTPARVHAEWLPGASHAISVADSASPDAPVTSYAYGPRAHLSLGGDLALFSVPARAYTFRFGGSALLAFDDAERHLALPAETMRTAFELSVAWAFTDFAKPALGPGRELELSLSAGHRSALPAADFTLGDRYHSDDVPFGAGGNYLGVDLAFRSPLGQRFSETSRLGFRAYTNAFPDLFGDRVASDSAADSLHEGAEYQAWFELGTRVRAAAWAEPLARLYVELIEPHDDSAKPLFLARLLVGSALPGRAWELTPFTAFEAGHGPGLQVNRTELRWSGGVRLYAR